MKRLEIGVIIMFLAAFIIGGCSQKSGTEGQVEAPAQEQTQPIAQQAEQAVEDAQRMAEPQLERAEAVMEEIRGTLVETEQGMALFSDIGNFSVAGQDVSDLVGKSVLVVGTIEEDAEQPTINISSVSVIE